MIQFIPLKRLGLLAISLLAIQTAFSQENYMPAYVIKNNADTLHGFVDYREWKENPNMIWFKTGSESESVSYKPKDIKEFSVADNLYVSGIVDVEHSRGETRKLDQFPELRMRVDTAFLQTIFKSDKSLYLYKSVDGITSFYIKNDTAFELLLYKRYIEDDYGKLILKENKTFISQLILYLIDCNKIRSKIEHASYNLESLTVLFKNYYKCMPSEITFQKKSRMLEIESGFFAGVSRTSLKFTGTWHRDLVNTNYPRSNNISGGFYLDFILPGKLDRWSISNEVMYSTYKTSGPHEETYKNKTSTVYTTLGMTYVKLNNMIRYKQPVGKMHLFINGGFSNGYVVHEINTSSKTYRWFGEQTAIYQPNKYELGLIGGAGASYNRFSLEFRYETSTGIDQDSDVKRIFCLLGYRF